MDSLKADEEKATMSLDWFENFLKSFRMGMGLPGPSLGPGLVASRSILGAMGRSILVKAYALGAQWVTWVDPNIFLLP